ncbi:MAG: ECF transporter S component [Clostridia bacterium]|nr:ECF transporter S component [Clostridia bacterium]
MIPSGYGRLRAFLRFAIPLAFIPAMTLAGALFLDKKRYLLVSLGIAVSALLLFDAAYESRRSSSGSAAAAAVMTALAVTGRLIPVIKPSAAIIILTGIWLGPETGFLTGALTALLSNMIFGQGPWTPFQMLAWGLTGLIAGYLSRPLKKSRIALTAFGLAAGAAYSLLMDVYTVLSSYGEFTPALYYASVLNALPFTLSYMISDALFLFVLSEPLGKKLERLKKRLIE